ncbi:hypothetical protein ACLBR5_14950 [Escherichia coli]
MKRRQVLKALGISAAHFLCLTLRMPICLAGLKGTIARPPAGKPLEFSKPAAWQNNLPLTPVDKVWL